MRRSPFFVHRFPCWWAPLGVSTPQEDALDRVLSGNQRQSHHSLLQLTLTGQFVADWVVVHPDPGDVVCNFGPVHCRHSERSCRHPGCIARVSGECTHCTRHRCLAHENRHTALDCVPCSGHQQAEQSKSEKPNQSADHVHRSVMQGARAP